MKSNIKTLLDSVEMDNAEFIKENVQTVAEYFLENAEAFNQGWYFFLTDDEIEEFERNVESREKSIQEIEGFVNSFYNYTLS